MRTGIKATGNLIRETRRRLVPQTRPSQSRGLFFVICQGKEILRKRPRSDVNMVKVTKIKRKVARLTRSVTKVGRSVSSVKRPQK